MGRVVMKDALPTIIKVLGAVQVDSWLVLVGIWGVVGLPAHSRVTTTSDHHRYQQQ